MLDMFGLSRVLEPRGTVPVTAWRVDNRRELAPGEMRVSLSTISLEKDSFHQICSDCGWDEAKMTAKILDIVERRGKLHNPSTDSGGIFHGVIEEMGEEYARFYGDKYAVGDEIVCLASMTATPVHLEEILEIDYAYEGLKVKGYAIVFQKTPILKRPEGLPLNVTLNILDEAGSLSRIHALARPGMQVLVLGRDPLSTLVYSSVIRKALGRKGRLVVVLDRESCNGLSEKELRQVLGDTADVLYVLDVDDPIGAYDYIMEREQALMDLTVSCEELTGVEALGVLLTRDQGWLYFTSPKNNSGQAVLVAESLGKELVIHVLDQYSEGHSGFAIELLTDIRPSLAALDDFYQKKKQSREREKLTENLARKKIRKIDDFVFMSPVTAAMVEEALNVAEYDCNVIIQGETGVGKEKVLSLIHKNSARRSNPCVKINCATIQENLAESEFFGYEAGSFTGAQAEGKKGYFELADKGILFLDEVGQLSLSLQSKLLRVLQENQFYRLGGTRQVSVNVRVICANNVPLRKLVEEGKFREDLYYRLNICRIEVPPLRQRPEDVYCLARAFLEKYNKRYGVVRELRQEGLERLYEYDWPGNVRELENLIHRLVINTRGDAIGYEEVDAVIRENIYDDLVLDLKQKLRGESRPDFNRIIEEQEQKLIGYALRKCGSTRKAAEYLNMTQAQLMRKKQKYGIAIE
ncbi:MAG: sigma 54-interacting transcriptional regulator [Bacillota bacterium]|nr:sigma 54-interacting transcriptional regulator [Bacillota bacterium]